MADVDQGLGAAAGSRIDALWRETSARLAGAPAIHVEPDGPTWTFAEIEAAVAERAREHARAEAAGPGVAAARTQRGGEHGGLRRRLPRGATRRDGLRRDRSDDAARRT